MKRTLATLLALVLALSGVGIALGEQQALTTIRFFPGNAMAGSGELTGWNGRMFAEHGLAIEVLPYSAEKLQAMLASGDMADVIWLPQQEMLVAAEGGMLLELDEYIGQIPNMMEKPLFAPSIEYARQYNSNGTGSLYYLAPVGPPSIAVAADTDRNAIKMNWEIYAEAGYPTFETLEDVIPVLAQMQEVHPTSDDGLPTYGMHLFADFDSTYFWNMNSVYSILGKSFAYLPYGIEFDPRDHSSVSIFAEDSVYHRGLRFMYAMNKAGLMDPDSMSQTRAAAKAKIDNGAALAGWAANPGWEAGGYYPVLFDEFVPNYSLATTYGTGGYCISANAKNVDAVLKFLNLLADEDFLLGLRNGPEGTTWEFGPDGMPHLTDYYFEWVKTGSSTIPMDDGSSWEFWNIGYLLGNGYISEKYGTSICYANWPEMYEHQYTTPLALDWTEQYGYPYLRALLEDKGWEQSIEYEGFDSFLTPDDDDMIMTKAALKDIIVPGSWQMVFADSEEQFESIWADMKQKCESLGLDDVIAYKAGDIAQARETYQAIGE